MAKRFRVDWRFAAVVSLVVTCLFTIQGLGHEDALPFAVAHRHELVAWGIWLALSPGIVLVARRLPYAAVNPVRWLWQQVGLAAAFAAVSLVLAAGVRAALALPDPHGGLIPRFAGELLRYTIIAMAYQAVHAYRAARERETLAARLRAELAEARVANLEGRLHPHFLFNTLNSIAALVRVDPEGAETMVEQLSELLRASLTSNPQREVALEDELQLVEQYLAIQRVRFSERLRTTVDATAAARRGLVPHLILQPLVENAIRHGIGPRESGGTVEVTATVAGDRLVITVDDDGVGVGGARDTAGSGLGLRSVRGRLEHLYGAAQRFSFGPRQPAGTRAVIEIPFRQAA